VLSLGKAAARAALADPVVAALFRRLLHARPWEELNLREAYGSFGSIPPSETQAGAEAWSPAWPFWLAGERSRRQFLRAGGAFTANRRYAAGLGSALIEHDRLDEARDLAARLLDGHPRQRTVAVLVEAEVQLRTRRFLAAAEMLLEEIESSVCPPCWTHLLNLAEISPEIRRLVTRRAAALCAQPPEAIRARLGGGNFSLQLFQLASHLGSAGESCVSAFDAIASEHLRTRYPFSRHCREGTEAWLEGDARGAVAAWRRIDRGVLTREAGCLVPVRALDEVDPDFASELDAPNLDDRTYGGIHLAHYREAKRAAKLGDDERASARAEQVIEAWQDADVDLPAVDEMKALLAALRDSKAP